MLKAILVDLDGTLSNCEHRLHYVKPPEGMKKNWPAFFNGIPNDPVVGHVEKYVIDSAKAGVKVIFFTARPRNTSNMTEYWLEKVFGRDWIVKNSGLIMREAKDGRPDYVTKEEMYLNHIKDKYEVVLAIDDKKEILEMFIRHGVNCIHPDNLNK